MRDLFFNISPKSKEKLLGTLEASNLYLKKGEKIRSSIKQDNIIGLVEKGILTIIKLDYNGNLSVIEELNEGSIFGSTMVYNQKDEYEIIAKSNTIITIIDLNSIYNYDITSLSVYNQFLKNLVLIMEEKIAKSNERIETLTNKTIRNKLLTYFNILSKKKKSNIFNLPFSYTILADYLAVDRSSMYREIKNLKEENLIKTKGRTIELLYYIK